METVAVDVALFKDFLVQHFQKDITFGIYDHQGRTRAVDGDGLAGCFEITRWILKQIPLANPSFVTLKAGFLRAIEMKPRLNRSELKPELFASKCAERVITICAHVRRLLDPIRMQQCKAKASGESMAQVLKLLTMHKAAVSGRPVGSPQKVLARRVSEISDDSLGLPSVSSLRRYKSASLKSSSSQAPEETPQIARSDGEDDEVHCEEEAEEEEEKEEDVEADVATTFYPDDVTAETENSAAKRQRLGNGRSASPSKPEIFTDLPRSDINSPAEKKEKIVKTEKKKKTEEKHKTKKPAKNAAEEATLAEEERQNLILMYYKPPRTAWAVRIKSGRQLLQLCAPQSCNEDMHKKLTQQILTALSKGCTLQKAKDMAAAAKLKLQNTA